MKGEVSVKKWFPQTFLATMKQERSIGTMLINQDEEISDFWKREILGYIQLVLKAA